MLSSLIHLAPFAALLAFISVGLTLLVVRMRHRHKLALGINNDEAMTRAVRAHGNFHEHAPFTLLLVALVALLGGASLLVTVLGALLVIGRISHAYSILIAEPRHATFRWRMFGMMCGISVLLVSGIFLLWQWLIFAL